MKRLALEIIATPIVILWLMFRIPADWLEHCLNKLARMARK